MNLNKTLKVSISVKGYTQKPQGKEVAQIRYVKQTLTIQQLIDYISQGHCITHCFEDYDEEFGQSTKKIENFRYTQLIGIDVDDSDVDLDTYISSLIYKPTLAYTTFSHKIKGNRFRLIYIFNHKIKGAELYCDVYKWLAQDLNLKDNCMQSCAQMMYGTNANAEWYVSDKTYDIPSECFQSTKDYKTKVSKASTQNQVDKKCQKWQSELNKKEEEHYIGNANKNDHLIFNNAVVKALYSMPPQDFIFYYRQTYDYFTATPLHYENGYALLPDDYCEITRPWYREEVGDNTITVVRRLRHGDKRKTHMTNTAVIIRKIKNDISFEHLLYILVCERQYYYDNQDKVLNNKELVNIAKWAMGIPINELNPKQIKHPKFKVDRAYWREQKINPRQAANIVRGIIKEREIGELYDCSLTDKANLAIMKEYGIKVSQRSLTNFKRKYTKSSGQNFTKSSNPNKIIERDTFYSNCQFTTENDHLVSKEYKNKKHNKARKMKQDIIKDYYNPQLTDEENVKSLNDNGLTISIKTLRRWRKSNGIQREIGGDRKSNDYKISKNQVTKNDDLKSSGQNQSIISDQSIKIKVSKSENQSIISDQSEEIKVQNSLNQSATLEKNIDLNKIPSSITDEKTLQLYANAFLKEMSTAMAWPAYTRNRAKYNKVMKNASSSINSDVINGIIGKYKTIETDRIEWIGIHVASILPFDSAYEELYKCGYQPQDTHTYFKELHKRKNAYAEVI